MEQGKLRLCAHWDKGKRWGRHFGRKHTEKGFELNQERSVRVWRVTVWDRSVRG